MSSVLVHNGGVLVSNGAAISHTASGSSTIIDILSVTQNGTYLAPPGHAYGEVIVNVSGGGSVTTASFGGICYTTIYYTNANMEYTSVSGEIAGATAPVGTLVVCCGMSEPASFPRFGLTQRATWGSKTTATTIFEVTG